MLDEFPSMYEGSTKGAKHPRKKLLRLHTTGAVSTSGLPLETDIVRAGRHVSKVPQADIGGLETFSMPRYAPEGLRSEIGPAAGKLKGAVRCLSG
jgi:hypothetical protein